MTDERERNWVGLGRAASQKAAALVLPRVSETLSLPLDYLQCGVDDVIGRAFDHLGVVLDSSDHVIFQLGTLLRASQQPWNITDRSTSAVFARAGGNVPQYTAREPNEGRLRMCAVPKSLARKHAFNLSRLPFRIPVDHHC